MLRYIRKTLCAKSNPHWCFRLLHYCSRIRSGAILSVMILASIAIPSSAERPSAAHVVNFEGNSNEFWVRRQTNETDTIAVEEGVVMRDGGVLSVPTADYWASFGFVGGGDSYAGLIVKTTDRGTYTFPCQVRGNFILAWSGSGAPDSGQRACSQGDQGIEIDRSSAVAQILSPGLQATYFGLENRTKQDEGSHPDANLSINPDNEQTVIRIVSTPLKVSQTTYPLVECTPEICTAADGSHIRLEETVILETDRVTIEVVEGAVSVQVEGDPEATRVREGEKITYPNESIATFDPRQAATSCEMLRFLNTAYWVSDDTPQSLAVGIAAQLKQHRQSLGVEGSPPTSLSNLEQEFVEELNKARTDPSGYADLIEQDKQYFYTNWLQIRGYALSPSERRQFVDEAITFLRTHAPLPELAISNGMSQANQDHVIDQGRSGRKRGHTGDNFSGPSQRLSRHGTLHNCGISNEDEYENVVYLSSQNARQAVMEMLIADNLSQAGYEDAGDRSTLFNPEFQVMGVACGTHAYLQNMCVVTYGTGYSEG
jgi:uncharacterized protein YkwD